MLKTIKSIILDFQQSPIIPGVPRHVNAALISGKATICMGVRRSGKSTYMFQIMNKLLDEKTPKENIILINFFDDRLHTLRHDNLSLIPEAYFSLYPEKKNTETVHFFFDEIQAIDNWEPFIDRLMRTEKCQVYITGSSSNMLSKEIATQMRGRALSWELFPFSFQEFLTYKSIDVSRHLSTRDRLIISKTFEEYWQTGGFPEVLGQGAGITRKIHQEYLGTMLFRDLIDRHDIAHPRAVTDLAHWLLDNVASLYSINNLTNYLKSMGHAVPKSSVADYLEWFEDAYFLFTVKIFDSSVARSNTNPKKIYCIDHAFVRSVNSGILVNSGHLLENIVFITLRRAGYQIFYYKTKNSREIDFIAQDGKRSRLVIQCCENIADPDTRKRELVALEEALNELKITQGMIVTRSTEEKIQMQNSAIEVVPIWQFLLNLQHVQ